MLTGTAILQDNLVEKKTTQGYMVNLFFIA